jgi:L,D-peptidoglycan transpeptidase YkuD (ErfK/YbiS/YcfS/YnhG family)
VRVPGKHAVVGAATALVLLLASGCAGGGHPASRAAVPPVPAPAGATDPLTTGGPSASASASASASPSAGRSASVPPSPPRPRATTGAPAAAPGTPSNLASRLRTLPAATRQVIIVHGPGYGTTTATVETFTKSGRAWRPAFAPMSAWVGSIGFSDHKTENDSATPTGVYGIGGTMYGIAANPGVGYGYHQLVSGDYWDENPATPEYNTFVHGSDPGGNSEALWQISPQYTYFAVINYNSPPVSATPALGSGIFLHVSVGHPTAGCVALAQGDLVSVLDWLDPAAAPRIVLAPDEALSRY